MKRWILFTLGTVLTVAAPAWADTIRLKNGNTLRGTVTGPKDGQVTIDMPGAGLLTFSQDEVAAIEREPGTAAPSASAGSGVSQTQVTDRPITHAAAVSEMSVRFVPRSGDVSESGMSLVEYPDEIVLREYQFPRDDQSWLNQPDRFYDRSTPVSKSRHQGMWNQLATQSAKRGLDVWKTPDELPLRPGDTQAAPCEARLKYARLSLVHKSYSCLTNPQSLFSLVHLIVGGSVPSHRKDTAAPAPQPAPAQQAAKPQEQDGVVKDYYPSGALKSEEAYQRGQLQGISKAYYESGALLAEVHYKDGKQHGPFTAYYESGAKKAEATYQDGKEEGIVRGFYEDGTLMRESTFTAGVLNGSAKQYYPSGALHIEDTVRNGTVVHRKTYDESGKLLAEETR